VKEIPTELKELAARGDKGALQEIRDTIFAEEETVRANSEHILSALRGSTPMTTELRHKLLRISQSCMQLGDLDLAYSLRLIAIADTNQVAAKRFLIEVLSDRKRPYKLLRLDAGLKTPALASECEYGFLPCELRLDAGVSYILSVETQQDEPLVRIPLYRQPDTATNETINIDLTDWQGLGQSFVWIPRLPCAIGGDIAARDPLPDMTVEAESMIVSRTHVRMRDYLILVQKEQAIIKEPSLVPLYMGEPLVEYYDGEWKPLDIPVRPGNDWLDIPVIGIDFDCAKWYCSNCQVPEHLQCDLLTEYEWEALARGPDGRLFPWGDLSMPGFANIRPIDRDLDMGLESVGSRETDVSAFNLFDCSGNAEEWCKLGSGAIQGGEEDFAVARGGSWYNPEQASRLASRVVRLKDYRHKKLTFRVSIRKKVSN
jgi:formylglycine-generating enzyme required for sulfatase activity